MIKLCVDYSKDVVCVRECETVELILYDKVKSECQKNVEDIDSITDITLNRPSGR